jgi:hypothetical protein
VTAEEHNKTLATLHFVYGGIHGLTLAGLLLLILVIWSAAPAVTSISTTWIIIGIAIFLMLMISVGVLPLLVGYGLARRKRWAKTLGFVLAIISLVNIPIGTALGIYTIKFLGSEGGVRLHGGGRTSANESELENAMRGAQPLMNLAERWK